MNKPALFIRDTTADKYGWKFRSSFPGCARHVVLEKKVRGELWGYEVWIYIHDESPIKLTEEHVAQIAMREV